MRDKIEKLLDLDNSYIKNLYNSWDKGDCSTIGLARILLIQEIFKEMDIRGEHYDGQYEDFLEGILNKYDT